MSTRILLADDHVMFREAVRALIEGRAGLSVVGEASDGREALEAAARLAPDIVVLASLLPRLSGVEAARRLGQAGPRPRSLLLLNHEGRSHVEEALRSGASGYLCRRGSGQELLRAIEALRQGQSYLAPAVARHVVDAIHRRMSDGERGGAGLTGREREVLQLVAEGFSSKEIAAELGVSIRTVESHRANLMAKLDIHKVSGLVRFAIREGLLAP